MSVEATLPSTAARLSDPTAAAASAMIDTPLVRARPTPSKSESARPTPAFTLDGSPELEAHLARTCEKIAAGLRGLLPRRKLQAVLLGGGYGRGEGGVLRTPEGDRPYNDLEFYVCLRGNRHLNEKRYGRALHVLGEILTPQAGIEVEFKIASLRELATRPVSMFSYDLITGHRWLIGSEPLLARCGHHRDGGQIPLSEATRLLMNRCSGLLFAHEKLQRASFTPGDADFTRRNIAKAQLALGDAVLVSYGQYHRSVQERHRRLERIVRAENTSWTDDVLAHHAAGVEFKLHPQRSAESREALAPLHQEIAALAHMTWRWIEARRLRVPFRTTQDYVRLRVNKCPETNPLRNVLLTLKVLGPLACFSPRVWRHPRERIFHALSLLLWEPHALTSPVLLRRIQRELRTSASTLPALVARYREIWQHVN